MINILVNAQIEVARLQGEVERAKEEKIKAF